MPQITCQRNDKILGHSIRNPSKRKRHTGVVSLHGKFYLNLNRHIWTGKTLTNIGLWNRVPKIATGFLQKAEYLGRPWYFEKRIANRNSYFETCRISNIGHILGRLKSVFAGLSWSHWPDLTLVRLGPTNLCLWVVSHGAEDVVPR